MDSPDKLPEVHAGNVDQHPPDHGVAEFRRTRTTYSKYQNDKFELFYKGNPMPSSAECAKFGEEIDLSLKQVQKKLGKMRSRDRLAYSKNPIGRANSPPAQIRDTFSEEAKMKLEELFEKVKYPTREMCIAIAEEIGKTYQQVKKWFYRQRQKTNTTHGRQQEVLTDSDMEMGSDNDEGMDTSGALSPKDIVVNADVHDALQVEEGQLGEEMQLDLPKNRSSKGRTSEPRCVSHIADDIQQNGLAVHHQPQNMHRENGRFNFGPFSLHHESCTFSCELCQKVLPLADGDFSLPFKACYIVEKIFELYKLMNRYYNVPQWKEDDDVVFGRTGFNRKMDDIVFVKYFYEDVFNIAEFIERVSSLPCENAFKGQSFKRDNTFLMFLIWSIDAFEDEGYWVSNGDFLDFNAMNVVFDGKWLLLYSEVKFLKSCEFTEIERGILIMWDLFRGKRNIDNHQDTEPTVYQVRMCKYFDTILEELFKSRATVPWIEKVKLHLQLFNDDNFILPLHYGKMHFPPCTKVPRMITSGNMDEVNKRDNRKAYRTPTTPSSPHKFCILECSICESIQSLGDKSLSFSLKPCEIIGRIYKAYQRRNRYLKSHQWKKQKPGTGNRREYDEKTIECLVLKHTYDDLYTIATFIGHVSVRYLRRMLDKAKVYLSMFYLWSLPAFDDEGHWLCKSCLMSRNIRNPTMGPLIDQIKLIGFTEQEVAMFILVLSTQEGESTQPDPGPELAKINKYLKTIFQAMLVERGCTPEMLENVNTVMQKCEALKKRQKGCLHTTKSPLGSINTKVFPFGSSDCVSDSDSDADSSE